MDFLSTHFIHQGKKKNNKKALQDYKKKAEIWALHLSERRCFH